MSLYSSTIPSPGNPTNPSGDSLWTKLQDDYNQWYEDQQQIQDDLTQVLAMLDKMKKAEQGGHYDSVSVALQMAFMCVFPTIFSEKEDNINQLSDSMNISSDLRTYVTSIQNDFNNAPTESTTVPAGSTQSPAETNAQDLIDRVTDLNRWVNFLQNSSSGFNGVTAIDATDATNITTAISDITTAFGKDWGCSANMATDMTNWNNPTPVTPPSGGTPIPPEPAPQIKEIQGDLQQANSSVSTMSTTTQTTEQFYTNEYNQITGIDNSMQQSWVSGQTSMINNQKSN